MKKIHYVLLLAIVLFFTACGKPTSALNYFEKDQESANAIQFTKKRDLLVDNDVQALVFVTYLNRTHEKYKNEENKEHFLLGVHLTNPNEKHSIYNDYTLTMNEKAALDFTSIGKNPEIIKNIPLKNKWAQYYIFTFENEKDLKNLNLEFTHSKFGKTSLKFEK